METYEAGIVIKVVEISRNLLSRWQGHGLIRRKIKAKGKGTRNVYSFENICQIELFHRLIKEKFSRKKASGFAFDKKTETAFAVIRSFGGANELRTGHYLHNFQKLIEGVSKTNPLSGETTERKREFSNPHIRMIFFRYPNGRIESSYFDHNNFDDLGVEFFTADSIYIIDLFNITLKILERLQLVAKEAV